MLQLLEQVKSVQMSVSLTIDEWTCSIFAANFVVSSATAVPPPPPPTWRSALLPASDQLANCYDFLNKEDNCEYSFSLRKSAT
jgi:hypothetical protein